MKAKFKDWWQKIKQYPIVTVVIIGALVIGVALIVVIILGYQFSWAWTGVGSYSPPSKNGVFQREKTLWDWLQLLGTLAVPVVVGFGTVWFTTQLGKVSEGENKDNQHEAALQAYIDKISELLLHEHLSEPKPEYKEVRKIARVQTLTVLPRLDGKRKGSVLRFLYESGLIADKRIIELKGANLRETDLTKFNLTGANLAHADLTGANLSGAMLESAVLTGANLSGAVLESAYIAGVNLTKANLEKANLKRAYITYTDLIAANLAQADLTGANLEKDIDLTGAILTGAILTGVDLTEAELDNATLDGANLKGATYTEEQLAKATSIKDVIR
jgi:uncharacterized protein YjbI with pentapeptide repeats